MHNEQLVRNKCNPSHTNNYAYNIILFTFSLFGIKWISEINKYVCCFPAVQLYVFTHCCTAVIWTHPTNPSYLQCMKSTFFALRQPGGDFEKCFLPAGFLSTGIKWHKPICASNSIFILSIHWINPLRLVKATFIFKYRSFQTSITLLLIKIFRKFKNSYKAYNVELPARRNPMRLVPPGMILFCLGLPGGVNFTPCIWLYTSKWPLTSSLLSHIFYMRCYLLLLQTVVSGLSCLYCFHAALSNFSV